MSYSDHDGKEPDPRFTLANERTFLTWISTSLALSAAGVAVAALPGEAFLPWLRTALAVTLVLLSATAAVMAYPRWRRVQGALRRESPLPPPALAPVFGYGVAAVALLALVMVLLGR